MLRLYGHKHLQSLGGIRGQLQRTNAMIEQFAAAITAFAYFDQLFGGRSDV